MPNRSIDEEPPSAGMIPVVMEDDESIDTSSVHPRIRPDIKEGDFIYEMPKGGGRYYWYRRHPDGKTEYLRPAEPEEIEVNPPLPR